MYRKSTSPSATDGRDAATLAPDTIAARITSYNVCYTKLLRAMAERLAKAGCDITVWNRTREKAEPLAKSGAKIASSLTELAACDVLFTMVATGKDVKEVV